MGLCVSQSNSSYSRVLTEAIQKSQRFKRLEIELQNIFSDCENQRNTSNRPICFPTEPSVTKIHVLASGPRQLCSRFPSALLEKPLRVCIPSILLNRKGTCQSKEGPVSYYYYNTSMANSAMVRNITLTVGIASHNSTQSDTHFYKPLSSKSTFCRKVTNYTWRHRRFQESLSRSAVSAYHVHIDNNHIGQHPKVCTLMTSILNNRPPKPRYTFV